MKRTIFIGQAPAKPGSKNTLASNYLMPWLRMMGISEADITKYFKFYALTDTFPGSDKAGHLRPSNDEIIRHRPQLIKDIQSFKPQVIVPVGGMAIKEILSEATGILVDIIGNAYTTNPYSCLSEPIEVIPLPHPSGKSTWLNQNSDLLVHALTQLGASIES